MLKQRVKRNFVGSYAPKIDAERKARGQVEYFDDVTLPGRIPRMCYARILTCPYANARIRSMDSSAAEALPGVYAVLRYDDPEVRAIPITTHSFSDIAIAVRGRDSIARLFDRWCLTDTGRWVGDQLGCAVAAETQEIAEEALRLLKIDWEILAPPALTREEALRPEAVELHPELGAGSNRQPRYKDHLTYAVEDGPYLEYGDVDTALSEADAVASYSGTCGGNSVHATMDFRGCVIDWRPDKMDVWTNHYFNDQTRMYLHEHLNVPMQRIRVRNGHCGGHMGKWNMGEHTFFLITALLSKRSGRPVKYKMTCREEFLETRNMVTYSVTLAGKKDGTITATDFYNTSDSGAYFGSNSYPSQYVVEESTELLLPCVPNVRANDFCWFSNRMPGAVMRGIGNIQYAFGFCQAVDILAEKLGMDPVDVAKKNVGNAVLPPPNDSIAAVLDACAEEIGWKEKRHAPGAGPLIGGCRKRGIGMAFHNQWHAEWQETKRGRLEASIRITPDLGVILNAPTAETGAGGNSAAVLACCDQLSFLNVTPEDVMWIDSGDTERGLRDVHPSDSAVSFLLAELMPECARNVKKEFIKRAALLLDRKEEELDLENARVFVKSDPSVGMDAKDVMYGDDCVPIYGYAVRQNDRTNTGIPYGAWFVEVEVDVETGKVEVTDLVIASDAGTILHASGAESQQLGGQCMGLGESIYEEIAYDPHTGTPLNTNYIDYKIPLMKDFPSRMTPILLEVWRGAGEYGACGMAEGTGSGTLAAIGNAIYNAVGVRLDGVPFKPEKILEALDRKEAEA